MFKTPQLAAEITCQPINILRVDAAILFADILTLPGEMGFDIRFEKSGGPMITNPIRTARDLQKIRDWDHIPHIETTISLVNQMLPQSVPLIGFAGAPFTVLTYLIEGGSSARFKKTISFAYQQPKVFHSILKKLTHNTIRYLDLQKQSGIKVFQLFDTWAGILRPLDYENLVLPYLKMIFSSVKLPSIYYLKSGAHLIQFADQTGADFISVCHQLDLGDENFRKRIHIGVQGNLFNELLFADNRKLNSEVSLLLKKSKKYPKYIFNLSHGVFPDTDVNKLKMVVKLVHQFKK